MFFRIFAFLSALTALSCSAVAADATRFSFPLQCTPGDDCWIMNYMDMSRQMNIAEDYTCGARTYDSFNGTAIAVRNLKAKVAVVAATDGTVIMALDGKEGDDILKNPCGAGLSIVHESGWQTRYCHLLPGSVAVKAGQAVRKGEKLGLVGMSGKADWPQLHFDVQRDGMFFDPFSGHSNYEGCGLRPHPLWDSDVPYQPFSVFMAGISAGQPHGEKILKGFGRLVSIPSSTPAMVLWGYIFGAQPGDRVDILVLDPQGQPFINQTGEIQDNTNPRLISAERQRDGDVWQKGLYTGTITITRKASGKRIYQDLRSTSIDLQ